MRHTSVRVAGASVAVHCLGDAGLPIVFVHGNSGSHRSFQRQYDSRLAERFRLIAIDLPGHGDSEPALDPATTYTLPGHARALVEVAKTMDAMGGVFVGWSLGGYVVLEAIPQLPQAAGFLVIGAPPIASAADLPEALSQDPALQAAFREESTDEELSALVALYFKPGTPRADAFLEDVRQSDKRARSALAASAMRNEMTDEVRIVANLDRPLAVFHGQLDAIAKRPYADRVPIPTLWRGAVQEFADCGHAPHWERPELFNRLLEEFVLDCVARR
jgi:pimeloyl-ACP methyl ester carboxylesterase